MCRLCDNPNADGDAEDDLDGLRSAIRDHLWVVKCVPDERRPYAYTLGLHELGLPELLATGVTTDRALALMDYFAPEVIQNGPPAPGDRIAMSEIAMFEAVQVDHPDVHMKLGDMTLRTESCGRCNSSGLTCAVAGRGTPRSTTTG